MTRPPGTQPPLTADPAAGCPVHRASQRKVAVPGERHEPAVAWVDTPKERVLVIRSLSLARHLLRMPEATRQAGFLGDQLHDRMTIQQPILYLEGPAHREQRAATARFFAPKIVSRDYQEMIDALVDDAVRTVRTQRTTRLDTLSLRLSVAVAARVVGLTDSDPDAMARRLQAFFDQPILAAVNPRDPRTLLTFLRNQRRVWTFHWFDVRPAIRARRAQPDQDVITHLIGKGYREAEILTECITFASAGMVTTREFISMATWHLLADPGLRARYLAGDPGRRFAILSEILRLEPVVGHLRRRTLREVTLDVEDDTGGTGPLTVPAGTLIDIQVRSTNIDEAVFGPDALCLRPGRDLPRGVPAAGLAFGDGPHRCPGEFLALQETDALLTRLLALDLRIERTPTIRMADVVAGYDLRQFVLSLAGDRPWQPPAAAVPAQPVPTTEETHTVEA